MPKPTIASPSLVKRALEQGVLSRVEKPARYIGGEYGSLSPKEGAECRVALAFPDLYEVGMSHLGLRILYSLANSVPGASCERVFAPALDMASEMKREGIPLYALESFSPLSDFSILGFSLEYELCLTNVLYMLDLARLPLLAKDRKESDPIVIAGGPCCVNPEPFRDYFDAIFVGEAEESLPRALRERILSSRSGEG
ncbi:MAG: hypothetical protein LBC69_02860, partial [Eubacteriaceae bacterium]|nr:hypothetical protein [Eubacteriaceae bacterium]